MTFTNKRTYILVQLEYIIYGKFKLCILVQIVINVNCKSSEFWKPGKIIKCDKYNIQF